MSSTQYALTTTFTPAASCAPGSFDQLLYRGQYIYLNYPNPVLDITTTGCYPSEFLQSYAVQNTISTLLPPFAPLICPDGWTSAIIDYAPEIPTGYVACCPSGYELAGPSPPWPEARPAFNATCRSLATSLTITPYSNDSALPVAIWTGTAGDHAYALPLEGYATATATTTETILGSSPTNSPSLSSTTLFITSMTSSGGSTLSAPTSTSNSTSSSSSQATQTAAPIITPTVQPSHSDKLGHGEVAGIVIGSVVGFFVIAAVVTYWIRGMSKRSRTSLEPQDNNERPFGVEEKAKSSIFSRSWVSAKRSGVTELPDGQGSRVELPTGQDSRAELSAGEGANRAELPN